MQKLKKQTMSFSGSIWS